MPYAAFVKQPRTIGDLLHPNADKHRFEVVTTVVLESVDYENFITDMIIDRPFLSNNFMGQAEDEIWSCIFVTQIGTKDGVVVFPNGCRVHFAAYMTYDGDINSIMTVKRDAEDN